MPTKDDFQELIDNTSTEVTSINNIQGMKFISKKNGNYLFFPFAGYAYLDFIDDVGSDFGCWPSSLHSIGNFCAWNLYGNSEGDMRVAESYISVGLPIRGIYNEW